MNITNGEAFKTVLVTEGRKTGKKHSVTLRAVMYNNKVYFSRRNPNGDWLKNSLSNPNVYIKYDSLSYKGIAKIIKDEELAKKISQLKYSDKRAQEHRIVLEVTLCEQ